ncbi:unnamed protein product, partial [marine sediment metagenome]
DLCNVFSFRFPALQEPIDFKAEIERFNQEMRRRKRDKLLRVNYRKKTGKDKKTKK